MATASRRVSGRAGPLPAATAAAAADPSPSTAQGVASPPATTATQRVYDGLYNDILERRLAPGAWLREEELAERFAVSRTVVRQALHRLAQDQVIEQIHNRGARVPQPDQARAQQVFDARRLVECEIARRLAGKLSAAQVTALQTLVAAEARADRRNDRPTAIRLSGEFHRQLAQMAGNPVFTGLIEDLLPTTSLLMAQATDSANPGCVAHRHTELIGALAGTPAQAAAEMRRHLLELQRALAPVAGQADSAMPRDPFGAYRER